MNNRQRIQIEAIYNIAAQERNILKPFQLKREVDFLFREILETMIFPSTGS